MVEVFDAWGRWRTTGMKGDEPMLWFVRKWDAPNIIVFRHRFFWSKNQLSRVLKTLSHLGVLPKFCVFNFWVRSFQQWSFHLRFSRITPTPRENTVERCKTGWVSSAWMVLQRSTRDQGNSKGWAKAIASTLKCSVGLQRKTAHWWGSLGIHASPLGNPYTVNQ